MVRPEPYQPFDEILFGHDRLAIAPSEFRLLLSAEAFAESHRRLAWLAFLTHLAPFAQVVVLRLQVVRAGRQCRRGRRRWRTQLRLPKPRRGTLGIVDAFERPRSCTQPEPVGGADGFTSDHAGAPWVRQEFQRAVRARVDIAPTSFSDVVADSLA